MMVFSSASPLFRRVGLWLLLAQFSVFIFALPPLQDGLWPQNEQVIYVVFLGAVASALWCFWGMASGALASRPCHPLWLCMALWLAWQVVAGMAAPSPWRSWFGPPETGEGGGWYMALLLLMALASPFWQVASCRRAMLYAAMANILVQGGLHTFYPLSPDGRYLPGSWRPASWAAYLSFMAGYVWMAWAAHRRAGSVKDYAVIAPCMLVVLAVSASVSGMVTLGAATLVSVAALLLARQRSMRRFLYPHKRWRMVFIAACMMPLAWVAFSGCFTALEPYIGHTMLSNRDSSMGSRLYLNQIALDALKAEPRRWLVGKGWGGFADVTFPYALQDGVSVFGNGVRSPTTVLIDGYGFHSHNQALEALLSLGLPGLVLWFAVPVLLLATLPRRLFWQVGPMLAGMVWLSALWFELAQCLAYQAMALVALAEACRGRIAPLSRKALLAAFACGAVIMGVTASQEHRAIRYGMELREAAHALPAQDFSQSWLEQDIARGGDRLRNSALFYATWLSLKMRREGIDDNDVRWYGKFLQAAEDANASPKVGAGIAAVDARLKYAIMINLSDKRLDNMRAQAAQSLPDTILALAERAPRRDDVAALGLVNLPNILPVRDEQAAFLRRLLEVAPDHRGALWVLGGILSQTPGHESEGRQMQARAVAMGVQHVYPVTDRELAAFSR